MHIPFQVRSFLLHLRLPYQFCILSGAYLLGGVLSPQIDLPMFLLQYVSVHFFLFGGVTVYNSYWDKDEGPIGGLKNPPRMAKWMLPASWVLQGIGLVVGLPVGRGFTALYIASMILSWAYSSPGIRWKGRPLLSVVATGSAIAFSSLMGFYAYGGNVLTVGVVMGCVTVSLLIISLYPLSQVYQIPEDTKRGDRTFAVTYGIDGVRRIFLSLYLLSITVLTGVLWSAIGARSLILFAGATALSAWILHALGRMQGNAKDYHAVMNIKYVGGIFLVIFCVAVLMI